MSKEYSGKCLCGAVTYIARGAPIVVAQCHCEECRRLSGTGHQIGAMFAKSQVTVTGAMNEYRYTSAKNSTVTKTTCAICASPIYGTNTRASDRLTLTLGTMDDARDLGVDVVIYARDKPHWDALGDAAEFYETQPD